MPKKPQQVNLLEEFCPETAPAPVPASIHSCTPELGASLEGRATPMPRLNLPAIGDNEFVRLWRWFGDKEGGGQWIYAGTVGFHYSVRQVMRPKTDIALPHGITPDQLNRLDE